MVKRNIDETKSNDTPSKGTLSKDTPSKRVKRSKEALDERNIKLYLAVITQHQMKYDGPNTKFVQDYADFFGLDAKADYQDFGTASKAMEDEWQIYAQKFIGLKLPLSMMQFSKEHVEGVNSVKTKCKTLSMAIRIREYKETLGKKILPEPTPIEGSEQKKSESKSAPSKSPSMESEEGGLLTSIWGFVKKTLSPWQQ
jgi:hypothetical protein